MFDPAEPRPRKQLDARAHLAEVARLEQEAREAEREKVKQTEMF